jgi:hypothetical protein
MKKHLLSLLFLLACSFAAQAQMSSNGKVKPTYGKTILSFAPIQMTNESPAGVGLSFEHFVDKDNRFSLYLPVAFAFYNDYGYTTHDISKNRVYTYFYPGMKIYPASSNHRVSYSVGPSLGLGIGNQYVQQTIYDPVTGYPSGYRYTEESEFKAGFLVNNGLNIQATPAFYMGLEFGIGIMYYSTHNNAFDEPLVQFQFKMGYRF